jgi:hypothetical protein
MIRYKVKKKQHVTPGRIIAIAERYICFMGTLVQDNIFCSAILHSWGGGTGMEILTPKRLNVSNKIPTCILFDPKGAVSFLIQLL